MHRWRSRGETRIRGKERKRGKPVKKRVHYAVKEPGIKRGRGGGEQPTKTKRNLLGGPARKGKERKPNSSTPRRELTG